MRLKVDREDVQGRWNFLSNHGHVVLCVAQDPHLTMREIAEGVGITERQVVTIIHELAEEGYLVIKKDGNRNVYRVNPRKSMRHPALENYRLEDLIRAFTKRSNK